MKVGNKHGMQWVIHLFSLDGISTILLFYFGFVFVGAMFQKFHALEIRPFSLGDGIFYTFGAVCNQGIITI